MGVLDNNGGGKGGDFKREKSGTAKRGRGGPAYPLSAFGDLGDAIECVIASGCYISFGRTSDGGATLIRILDGDSKLSSYCNGKQEIMEAMEAMRKEYPHVDGTKGNNLHVAKP